MEYLLFLTVWLTLGSQICSHSFLPRTGRRPALSVPFRPYDNIVNSRFAAFLSEDGDSLEPGTRPGYRFQQHERQSAPYLRGDALHGRSSDFGGPDFEDYRSSDRNGRIHAADFDSRSPVHDSGKSAPERHPADQPFSANEPGSARNRFQEAPVCLNEDRSTCAITDSTYYRDAKKPWPRTEFWKKLFASAPVGKTNSSASRAQTFMNIPVNDSVMNSTAARAVQGISERISSAGQFIIGITPTVMSCLALILSLCSLGTACYSLAKIRSCSASTTFSTTCSGKGSKADFPAGIDPATSNSAKAATRYSDHGSPMISGPALSLKKPSTRLESKVEPSGLSQIFQTAGTVYQKLTSQEDVLRMLLTESHQNRQTIQKWITDVQRRVEIMADVQKSNVCTCASLMSKNPPEPQNTAKDVQDASYEVPSEEDSFDEPEQFQTQSFPQHSNLAGKMDPGSLIDLVSQEPMHPKFRRDAGDVPEESFANEKLGNITKVTAARSAPEMKHRYSPRKTERLVRELDSSADDEAPLSDRVDHTRCGRQRLKH